ncbi:MAG: hypothetical protein V7K72_19330 [Nostoc sp.]|uniref:hypothetical protein n=1 Tax=Nostoc sp. TaxID=1180 RepID=UPI002FF6A898
MKRDSNWVMDFQKINYPIYSDYIFLTPPAPLLMQRLVIFSLEVPYPGFLTTPLKARACAGEQGSRGAGESSNTKFFPLCPSAPLPLCSIKRLKLVRNAGYEVIVSDTLHKHKNKDRD